MLQVFVNFSKTRKKEKALKKMTTFLNVKVFVEDHIK